MICFCGWPLSFQKYSTSLTTVSLASEPELAKNTRSNPGAIAASRAASSTGAGVVH